MSNSYTAKAAGAAPTSLEVVDAFDDFMSAFESFKETNDERLAQIERRVGPDVVTTEKMERINRALDDTKRRMDEMCAKSLRPRLAVARRPGDGEDGGQPLADAGLPGFGGDLVADEIGHVEGVDDLFAEGGDMRRRDVQRQVRDCAGDVAQKARAV